MDNEIHPSRDSLEIIKPRLRDVDLNLLTVFDAVMKTRSITGAARSLGMSQPAVSNAVSRLKTTFNDELFVRYGRGIQPTSRAFQLCGVVRHALQMVQNELPGGGFDPLSSERQFTLCVASPLDIKIIPSILDGVKYAAPHVRLAFNSSFSDGVEKQPSLREADFLICYEEDNRPKFKRMPLFDDAMVLVTGNDHPGFDAPLTMDDFYNQQHAVVSPEYYCSFSSPWYGTQDKQKSIAYYGMAITCVLNVVSQTQLVAVAPQWLVESVSNSLGLKAFALPFIKKHRTCFLSWHSTVEQDKGHLWIQDLIASSCSK